MESVNPLELIFTLILMGAPFSATFCFCEFGQMIGNQFNQFDDTLGQCDWYAFPIEMQQMLVVFLTSSQRPPMICGFGNTECTRDSFKRVRIRCDGWNSFSNFPITNSATGFKYTISYFRFIHSDNEGGIFILHGNAQAQCITKRFEWFLNKVKKTMKKIRFINLCNRLQWCEKSWFYCQAQINFVIKSSQFNEN